MALQGALTRVIAASRQALDAAPDELRAVSPAPDGDIANTWCTNHWWTQQRGSMDA